ncbi:AbrB/MazE/SpoVT family DNA-binding domain-containing protein [Chromobacterium haemolyticum]|uniref:antitoxin n=1 Tax=Chromobacterium haemolyticum TaxID=394935 RepID=UPI001A929626|nr:AbrB/MazE/SpoVT family DNA-binding domain-containing protein [Chromobacterium haemolyticum]MBO0501506.1 AbrB/MazE/SpoVT family DNA-binding domain-containing protein [Chromobacterium haemolyticum]
MTDLRSAKLFKNGSSQAVRLPAEFRFEGDEVFIRRDDLTGDVILTTRPGASTWSSFFRSIRAADIPAGYMATRPMNTLAREGVRRE